MENATWTTLIQYVRGSVNYRLSIARRRWTYRKPHQKIAYKLGGYSTDGRRAEQSGKDGPGHPKCGEPLSSERLLFDRANCDTQVVTLGVDSAGQSWERVANSANSALVTPSWLDSRETLVLGTKCWLIRCIAHRAMRVRQCHRRVTYPRYRSTRTGWEIPFCC